MRLAGPIALVVCLVWGAALVASVGAVAQAGTQKPGPCEDGWDAPTPIVVAVASVPITVSSTEDDYFVLYVKQDRGSDTVLNVPVSVTRGRVGYHLAFGQSVHRLALTSNRVEKYLVANPAGCRRRLC